MDRSLEAETAPQIRQVFQTISTFQHYGSQNEHGDSQPGSGKKRMKLRRCSKVIRGKNGYKF